MTELERNTAVMVQVEETGEVLNDMGTTTTAVVKEQLDEPVVSDPVVPDVAIAQADETQDHNLEQNAQTEGEQGVPAPGPELQAIPATNGFPEPTTQEQGSNVPTLPDVPVDGTEGRTDEETVGEIGEIDDQPEAQEATESAPKESEETAGATFTPVEESAESTTRRLRVKDLETGMELKGRVTSVALYGIFMDIGVGRDGLVHISEMSSTRINSPSDLVQIGDTVSVWVKSVDADARRISLTMRSPTDRNERRTRRSEINREALANLKVGDIVEGTITGMAQFGAFVDIGVGKDGLVHISELSDGRIEKPEDAVKVNQQYTFKLLEVDPEGNRISLSLRRAQRSHKMQQLTPGQILDGRISGMAPFGAFVDIGVGRDGLVHISQLSENHVNKVEDAVKIGDLVQVRVLEVDAQNKRISLTMRLEEPAEPAVEDESHPPVERPIDPAQHARFAMPTVAAREARESREGKRGRNGSGKRSQPTPQPVLETYTDDDDEEVFEGNATLEDLVSKFGKPGNRKSQNRRRREEKEEEDEDEGLDDEERMLRKRQREAQRRTLQQMLEEEGA